MLELVEMEALEVATDFGFSEDTPVIVGSARLALEGIVLFKCCIWEREQVIPKYPKELI